MNGIRPHNEWEGLIADRLRVLGHRNWIGVVDSAYPKQVAPGVEIVPTGEEHLRVLQAVFDAVAGSPHVRPIVYLDAELSYLDEAYAPGIGIFREELKQSLVGQEVQSKPHEAIIEKLDKAGQHFQILLLKTNLTLPYTSLFLQLDCGYWSAEAEKALRKSMKSGQQAW